MRRTLAALVTGLVATASAHAQFDHLTCFKAKDRLKLKGDVTLDAVLDEFDLGQCRIVGKAKLFCVPTRKSLGDFTVNKQPGTPLPVVGPEPVPARICYKVKCPKTSIPDLAVSDQFGTRDLRKFKVQMLCTPAVEGALPAVCQSSADCTAGEFCAEIGEDTGGDVPVFCTDGNPGGAALLASCSSNDECASGLCLADVCSVACQTDADCAPGSCLGFAGVAVPGFCQPVCDVLTQDCPAGDGCYLSLTTGEGTCAPPGAAGVQGEPCQFLNGCAIGYGCLLSDDPVTPTGLVCAFHCNAQGGSPSCADGPGPAFTCVALRDFYSNVPANVGDAIGICVDPNVWPIP